MRYRDTEREITVTLGGIGNEEYDLVYDAVVKAAQRVQEETMRTVEFPGTDKSDAKVTSFGLLVSGTRVALS